MFNLWCVYIANRFNLYLVKRSSITFIQFLFTYRLHSYFINKIMRTGRKDKRGKEYLKNVTLMSDFCAAPNAICTKLLTKIYASWRRNLLKNYLNQLGKNWNDYDPINQNTHSIRIMLSAEEYDIIQKWRFKYLRFTSRCM